MSSWLPGWAIQTGMTGSVRRTISRLRKQALFSWLEGISHDMSRVCLFLYFSLLCVLSDRHLLLVTEVKEVIRLEIVKRTSAGQSLSWFTLEARFSIYLVLEHEAQTGPE
jgi:hypothetical protein